MSGHKKRSLSLILGFLILLAGTVIIAQPAFADRNGNHGGHSRRYLDARHHHNRYYPARGVYVSALPRGHRAIVHRNVRYHFHGGVWYRAYGPRFVIVAPPIGLVVPFLPPYYATFWIGRVPYYYANEVYYTPVQGGYMIADPPKDEAVQTIAPADRLFIYPRRGQNQQQQAKDEYECHRWAADQTGFDPTRPNPGETSKRADYQRAMGACLDGRGYTVK